MALGTVVEIMIRQASTGALLQTTPHARTLSHPAILHIRANIGPNPLVSVTAREATAHGTLVGIMIHQDSIGAWLQTTLDAQMRLRPAIQHTKVSIGPRLFAKQPYPLRQHILRVVQMGTALQVLCVCKWANAKSWQGQNWTMVCQYVAGEGRIVQRISHMERAAS